MNGVIPYAMVGGGVGSFIGAVHRHAINLDGRARLVAGAFSATAARSAESGRTLGIDPDRAYASYTELIARESDRGDRPAFVVVVTPNDTHYPITKACLEGGFSVVCDKPFTITSAQARELEALANQRELLCVVTYNYSGYPMVREARERVTAGEIGKVRKVFAEYHQGWLATDLERSGQKQASWRTDPSRAGIGGSLGDIGTHAEQLVRFVTGLEIESVAADLSSFVAGRVLDDDASVLMRLSGGAKGTLTCSQVCVGEANGLSLRVYGETGGLVWRQEQPEQLELTRPDGSRMVVSRGGDGLADSTSAATRLPGGHPEGFIEAFGNLYRGVCDALSSEPESSLAKPLPQATEGEAGVRFVEACVESAKRDSEWTRV
ncbi:MAG: Gfo/Idh/MocA family oxidoreductase [Planctomycetota bacterium]